MVSLLVTRPEHDPLTRHLSHWNKKVIEIAESKGHEVVDLNKEKANKKEFEGRVNKIDPSLVLLNGHGDNRSVCGHNNEVLVSVGVNSHLLENRITYAVACSSARVLGVEVCAKNNTTFIGYDEYFILNLDRNFLANPLQDRRAERFLESSNHVAISLLKGHTCQEALNNSKRISLRHIASLLTSATDPEAIEDAKDLFWNMSHQVCLGDAESKI